MGQLRLWGPRYFLGSPTCPCLRRQLPDISSGLQLALQALPPSTLLDMGPTCPEPAIWGEGTLRFFWFIPVLPKHGGSPDQQLPFLLLEPWGHL